MHSGKVKILSSCHSRRDRESSSFNCLWTHAFVGAARFSTFYETVIICHLLEMPALAFLINTYLSYFGEAFRLNHLSKMAVLPFSTNSDLIEFRQYSPGTVPVLYFKKRIVSLCENLFYDYEFVTNIRNSNLWILTRRSI